MASSEVQGGSYGVCVNGSDDTGSPETRTAAGDERCPKDKDDKQQDIDDNELDILASDNITKYLKGDLVLEGTEISSNEFSTMTWKEDLTLIVEGKHLYVSSGVLALMSPEFSSMLETVFKEEGPRTLDLTDNYDDFVEFLRCIYPGMMKPVTKTNVLFIAPLAHKYQVEYVEETCTNVLLDMLCEQPSLEILTSLLNCASTCMKTSLREKCIIEMTKRNLSDKEMIELKLSPDIRQEIKTVKISVLEVEVQTLKDRLQQKTDRCVEFEYCILQNCLKDKEYDLKISETADVHLISLSVPANGKDCSEPLCFRNTTWTLTAERSVKLNPADQHGPLCVVLSAQGDRSWRWWKCKVIAYCHAFDGVNRAMLKTVAELGSTYLGLKGTQLSFKGYILESAKKVSVIFVVGDITVLG